ncbi:MAG TPA: acyl-CoA thioesterase [Patescibacteria group bacterium]|nr:acyl-CoA thioesterase [Patescibacteria group bacterium]
MQGETFTYPLTILERHLDTFSHVNNATYLEILEEARWDIIAKRGYTIDDIRQKGIGPVILGFTVKFLKELKLRQEIRVETRVVSYAKKICTMEQNIYNAANELCFESSLTLGLMDMTARKLILPTPDWLHAIGVAPQAA